MPRAFTEGRTFAERKALRTETPVGPRVASLGPTEFVQRERNGGTTVHDAELFVDLDHTSRMFVRLSPGGELTPLFDDQRKDSTTPLPALVGGKFRRPVTGRERRSGGDSVQPVAAPNELFRQT